MIIDFEQYYMQKFDEDLLEQRIAVCGFEISFVTGYFCFLFMVSIYGVLRGILWRYFQQKKKQNAKWLVYTFYNFSNICGAIFRLLHGVKSVQIRSYFWSGYRKIRTRNNSVFGHFSRSVSLLHCFLSLNLNNVALLH